MPPPAEGCRLCGGQRFWRHRYAGHWLCFRCYPPFSPEVVAEEHVAPKPAPRWVSSKPKPMTLEEIARRARRHVA